MLKNSLRITLSLAVSFAILALLLQTVNSGVSELDRPSVLTSLRNTDISLLSLYIVISVITLIFRAHRYQLLIYISGETKLPSFKQMLIVTGIRNMVVDMLPARLGELGYVGLLNRGYGVKLQNCISSLSISIAFDFIAVLIVVIFIVCKQMLGGELQAWAIGAMLMATIISAIAFAGLFIIAPWANSFLAKHFSAQDSHSVWAKLLTLSDDFCRSLKTAQSAGKTLNVMVLSLIIRVLKYTGLYLLFQAIAAPNFADLAALPFEHTVGALIGGEIGASLPIPTFMSFGAYEAGSALVFQLLGLGNQAAAFVTILSVHIWSQVLDYTLGGLFLITFLVVRNKKKTPMQKSNTSNKWYKRVAISLTLIAGALFFATQLWKTSKLGSIVAPASGHVAGDQLQWLNLSKTDVSSINGFVVFSSNRDGNHDIFKLELRDYKLTKLTDHSHTETYPRISPDGKNLVFSRAHQPWVSQRNTEAWDVYLLNLATLQETKIATNATAPAWANSQLVSFVQKSQKVGLFDIVSGQTSIIYQTGIDNPMPISAKIQNPKVNLLTGEIAFTARQSDIKMNKGHWGTAIASNETHQGIHNGCELNWNAKRDRLFQVHPNTGLNNSNRIVGVDKDTFALNTIIDLQGEFSHEYWPQESSNGKYMVFGASRSHKEHEHDVADYEIFLWKNGSQPHEATRLTFHTGNDNWPDVFIRD